MPSVHLVLCIASHFVVRLYHYNPWTDTTDGGCSSFELFRQQPVNFFMQRFAGMTLPVAEFLANKLFSISEDPLADPPRASAWELRDWVKDLPALFLASAAPAAGPAVHRRMRSISSTGHPIVSTAPNSRPQSRQASESRPVLRIPTTPTFVPAQLSAEDKNGISEVLRASELSPVIDEEREGEFEAEAEAEIDLDEDGTGSRSQSNIKRRKRGARKSKIAPADAQQDVLAESLALASQQLARELSRKTNVGSPAASEVALPPIPPSVANVAAPLMTKKPSKWKLSFGKGSTSGPKEGRGSPTDELPPPTLASDRASTHSGRSQRTLASNVTSIIMGLDASSGGGSAASSATPDKERGRVRKGNRSPVSLYATGTWDPAPKRPDAARGPGGAFEPRARGTSPTSSRGRQVASSASSIASSNWRSSMSSAASSTSAFTRYSNGSRQSVSTVATSLSSGSWRTNGSKPSVASSRRGRSPLGGEDQGPPPRNIKSACGPATYSSRRVRMLTFGLSPSVVMDGVPWALHQLPRGMHHKPEGDIFGAPPVPRKQRTRKVPNSPLNPITERAERQAGSLSPVSHRQDAATSTTDLSGADDEGVDSPKKVQKGQINALAKMLSALRR
jgi:hypothetical protein